MKNMPSCLLFGLLLLLVLSCEREEINFVPDYNTFCPIHFLYWAESATGLGSCNSPSVSLDASFSRDDQPGLIISQNLYQASRPFMAAYQQDSIEYRAFHRTAPMSHHQLSFEKIDMAPGTRVSLYLGQTRYIPQGNQYWMGDIPAGIDPGPSRQHKWQVFIQRETDETYTLGYIANGLEVRQHQGIPDFGRATFRITSDTLGRSLFYAAVNRPAEEQPTWYIQTEQLSLPPAPANLFAAFGLNIPESLQNQCEVRPVRLRLSAYVYRTNTPSEELLDYFECNSIIK